MALTHDAPSWSFVTDRRELLLALSALPVLATDASGQPAGAATPGPDPREAARARLEHVDGMKLRGTEQIAMVLYPGFTAIDLVGPHFFLAAMIGARVRLVTTGKDLAPVISDAGLAITPTDTLQTCPHDPDVVFVPGGTSGTVVAMQDRDLHGFLQECAHRARFVTSVCTGALVLASAGLLTSRRATTHWAALPVLEKFGARPTSERVVRDGKFITGAGVSAGLDFGVQILEELRGRPYAQAVMLQAEYAPQPPIKGGTVATTPQEISEPISALYQPFIAAASAVADAQVR